MHLQIVSDLHLELLPALPPGKLPLQPHPKAEVLVLAGDIHTGVNAIPLFAEWPVPVLYVAGNHEFYGGVWEEVRAELQRTARGTPIQVLDNRTWEYRGVRFLGCTLWTDFAVDPNQPAPEAMRRASTGMNDFFRIRSGLSGHADGLLTPQMVLEDHQNSRAWLEEQLAELFPGSTVVLSHHGPHRMSVHERFVGNPLNPAFVSDLTPLLAMSDLWIHGHTHDSFDYEVAGCRVVANPAGYPLSSPRQRGTLFQRENPMFDPGLLVEVVASA